MSPLYSFTSDCATATLWVCPSLIAERMKKKKQPRWPDYEVVKLPEGTVTFGTTLFMRKDHCALRIVFPAGQIVTFAPVEFESDSELTHDQIN